MNPIEQNAFILLNLMIEDGQEQYSTEWFQDKGNLTPQDINDAMSYLSDIGAVRLLRTFGTAPFKFAIAILQSRGRFIYNEIKDREIKKETKLEQQNNGKLPSRPFNPIGSPYGFTDQDWEEVSLKKEDEETLFVVLGMQFESDIYDRDTLVKNMRKHFEVAIEQYNVKNPNHLIKLDFEPLGAGLGEHLFNEIARSIIGADIALFETSHLNANVMLEMGVALTWGVRVIPLKEKNHPKPPSDVSGQTWVDYEESGLLISDPKFHERLVKAIERVIAMKGSH